MNRDEEDENGIHEQFASLGSLLFLSTCLVFWTLALATPLRRLLAPDADPLWPLFLTVFGIATFFGTKIYAVRASIPKELYCTKFSKTLDGFTLETHPINTKMRFTSFLGFLCLAICGIFLFLESVDLMKVAHPNSRIIGFGLLVLITTYYGYVASIPLRSIFRSKSLFIKAEPKSVTIHTKGFRNESLVSFSPKDITIKKPKRINIDGDFLAFETPNQSILIRKSENLSHTVQALEELKKLSQEIEIGNPSDHPQELGKLVKKAESQKS